MHGVMVIGSINLDTVVQCDRLPRQGETVVGRSIERYLGGKGANQAVAASGFAEGVTLAAVVGKDEAGAFLRRELENLGVDSKLQVAPDAPSGGAFITVDRRGENSIVIVHGANDAWPADTESILTRPMICVAQFEIPLNVTRAFFERNRKLGGKNILNPAPFNRIPQELLSLVDRLVVNESEYRLLRERSETDLSTSEVVEDFLQWAAPTTTILTLGDQGMLFRSDQRAVRLTAHRVNTIDATGAGDCFVGVYAALLSQGASDRDAILMANAAAALSVTRAGAARSMPTSDEVAAFVRSEGDKAPRIEIL